MSMTVPVAAGRDGRWMEDPGFGVYVHIPFCKHRCHYCDFNTYEGQDGLHAAYVRALIQNIEESAFKGREATSVFFGGGTPTLLPASALGDILDAVRGSIGLATDAEITVEANPETVDEAKFEALLARGFERVSIGVQSLVPRVLVGLGRTHSPATALAAIAAARRAGFTDVNADLIYGSPWETPADWRTSLKGTIEAGPDHISAYALTVEEGTPLATLVTTGRVPDVDPDVQADRHEVADEQLGAAGYERYEISNWARPGRASRHNVLYWSAGDYAGFGAGAHAHEDGRRSWATRLPRDFIDAVRAGASVESGHEVLAGEERAAEALTLGLRLRSGIDTEGFARRFGAQGLALRGAEIERLEGLNLIEREGALLRLSEGATMIANEVLSRLV
jgi:oxygen-independent coproporphyrinogen-3 oxidase